MLDFFMAHPETVRWELTSADDGFRLIVYHAQGTTVEFFHTFPAAVLRQQQLEELLFTARKN